MMNRFRLKLKAPLGGLKRQKRPGVALIMALYVTAIVFSLATFFVANQINKGKTVGDYKTNRLSLEGANLGLNYMVNYLGDLRLHWVNAVVIADHDRNAICGPTQIPYIANNSINITNVSFNNVVLGNENVRENDYTFNLANPVLLSAGDRQSVRVQGTLRIFYFRNRVSGEDCSTLTSDNPYALQQVSIDIRADLINQNPGIRADLGIHTNAGSSANSEILATRQIEWTGQRTLGLFSAFYQCWTCWDIPGGKYPNFNEGTSSASFIGNGFLANGGLGVVGRTSDQGEYYNIPFLQSPYGADQNGKGEIRSNTGEGLPPKPEVNNLLLSYGEVKLTGNSTDGVINGKTSQGTAIPSLTGAPWGPADLASSTGAKPTAPAAMLSAYNQAASDRACADGIKTVFVVGSADTGPAVPGSQDPQHVHLVESSPNPREAKPGYAVVDIDLNNEGKVEIKELGYYSGAVIFSETFDPAKLKNRVIYVHGGNVRVHGDLQKANLSIVSNQGMDFRNERGEDITPQTPTQCYAPVPNNRNAPLPLSNARRFSSFEGGPGSRGQDYWIQGSDFTRYCDGNANNCPGSFPPSNDPNCRNCLYGGIYQTSRGSDGAINAIGYHVDDTKGRPLTLDPAKFETRDRGATWETTDRAGFLNTIFAPPPKFNADGSFNGNTFIDGPKFVTYPPTNETKIIWPFPGSPTLRNLQQDPTTPDDFFYMRQFEYSEGNLTISGNTTFQGIGGALGLMARNNIVINDFVAAHKNGRQDYQTEVRATVVSTSNSMQWEGNFLRDPDFPNDTFVNGDYTAFNGRYGNGTPYMYKYTDHTGQSHIVNASSTQGAPLNGDSPLNRQPGNGEFWKFKFTGASFAPYQDVVNALTSNGNYVGYAMEHLSSDRASTLAAPPGLPTFSFAQLRIIGLPAFYATLSYTDLSALHAGP